ncbi:MAG: response regulator transcription factor [Saprospiraceae bacterium]|nr:response regulator transcription factor [Candidatus Opimibacter iunctus]
MSKIRISVLDDLREVAESLMEIFNEEEDMECRKVYFNAEDAMNFLPACPVDILIVDIGLPRASGIDAIRFLRVKCPAMQYCMFTVYEDDDKIFNSLQAGAKGYILKGSSPDKILEAVRELAQGGSPMSPSIARRVLDEFQKLQVNQSIVPLPLTPREQEVLKYLAQGMLYKEIGDIMGITHGTVKQHIHKIYEKLHVSNKTEAIKRMNEGQ